MCGVVSITTPCQTNSDKGGAAWSVFMPASCRAQPHGANSGHSFKATVGSSRPKQKESLNGPARRVVIHHTALQSCKGLAECKDRLLAIQRLHMEDRHFDDIGYNFLIGGDGSVFEGRGWGVMGAHTKGHNGDSLGIAFMGNFNNDTPSKEAMQSVKQLLRSGVSQGFIRPQFGLYGHRDLGATECPGEHLYAALSQLKS